MLSATLVEIEPALSPLAPLQGPLGDDDTAVQVAAVAGLAVLFVGMAVLQAWSYDWDWKCLVAECRRNIQGGRGR